MHLSLLRQAGYDVAFTSVSGGNGARTDPLRLHRYNVEPYAHRTFELVLAGGGELRGALEARELQIGDRLETDDGVAHVVSVTREAYDGQVWNLVLGTPEELKARGSATTMVANHIVVGDSRMQGVIKAERTAAAEAARAALGDEDGAVPAAGTIERLGAGLRRTLDAFDETGAASNVLSA